MVLATAVPKTKAAMKFQKAAQTTARKGVRTRVRRRWRWNWRVVPAVREFEGRVRKIDDEEEGEATHLRRPREGGK